MNEPLLKALLTQRVVWNPIAYTGIAALGKKQRAMNVVDFDNEATITIEMKNYQGISLDKYNKPYINGFSFSPLFHKKWVICTVEPSEMGKIRYEQNRYSARIPHLLLTPNGLYDGSSGLQNIDSGFILTLLDTTGQQNRTNKYEDIPSKILEDDEPVSMMNKIMIPVSRAFFVHQSDYRRWTSSDQFFPYSKKGMNDALSLMQNSSERSILFDLETDGTGQVWISRLCIAEDHEIKEIDTNPLQMKWMTGELKYPDENNDDNDTYKHLKLFHSILQNTITKHIEDIKEYIGEDEKIPAPKVGIYLYRSDILRHEKRPWCSLLGDDAQFVLDWHGIKRIDLGFLWLRSYLAFSETPVPIICHELPLE